MFPVMQIQSFGSIALIIIIGLIVAHLFFLLQIWQNLDRVADALEEAN